MIVAVDAVVCAVCRVRLADAVTPAPWILTVALQHVPGARFADVLQASACCPACMRATGLLQASEEFRAALPPVLRARLEGAPVELEGAPDA